MKTLALLSAVVAPLLPLSSSADQVKITTMVFKAPDTVNLPAQVRVISKSEWQKTLRTLASTKGTGLFVMPAARTTSGKTTQITLPDSKPASLSRRDDEPVLPISRIEYTPKETRGGIELIGNIKLKPGTTYDKAASGTVTSAKVRGSIPHGKIMTFAIGGLFFALEPSHAE